MAETSSRDISNRLYSKTTVLLHIINLITHLCLGAAVCCAFSIASLFMPGVYSTHIYLCTFGYILLMSLAVLTLSPYTAGWTNGINDNHKKTIHAVMQILGSVLAIIGSALVIAEHPWSFSSVHGAFGIVSFGTLFLTLIFGILNWFSPKLPWNEKATNFGHAFSGTLLLLLAFLSLSTGFSRYLMSPYRNYAIFSITVTTVAMFGTVAYAFVNAFRRLW